MISIEYFSVSESPVYADETLFVRPVVEEKKLDFIIPVGTAMQAFLTKKKLNDTTLKYYPQNKFEVII